MDIIKFANNFEHSMNLEDFISKKLSLRDRSNKERAKKIVINILSDPGHLSGFLQNYEDLKAQRGFYRDYLKAIKYDHYKDLKEKWLLKKDYNWSGLIIQKNEQDYLEWNYTTKFTDYKKNIDNLLFSWIYDFTKGQYVLTPDKIFKKNKKFKSLAKRNFNDKTNVRASIKNNFTWNYNENNIKNDLDEIIKEYKKINLKIKNMKKIKKRVDWVLKYHIVQPHTEEYWKKYEKNIWWFRKDEIKNIKNKYQININDFSDITDEKYLHKSKIEIKPKWPWVGFSLYSNVSVTRWYETQTPDLRKTETKNDLINLAGHTKEILKKNGYYNWIVPEKELDSFIKKSNVLVKKMKGKGSKFKEYKQKYLKDGIVEEKTRYKIA